MKFIHANRAENSRLRFVFNGTVVLFSLAADATLEDIALALALGELEPRQYGNPVAIDVTLAASSAPILRHRQIPRLFQRTALCADDVPNDHQGVFV